MTQQFEMDPTISLEKADTTADTRRDIIIGADDLESALVAERVSHLEDASKVPLVRAIGDETATVTKGSGFSWKAVLVMGGAGVLGGFLTWMLWQMVGDVESAFAINMMAVFSMVFVIGLAVVAVDVARSGSLEKLGKTMALAVPLALGIALILGLVAHFFYSTATTVLYESAMDRMLVDGWSEERAFDYVMTWLHPVRGAAWAIVGVAVGLTVGLSSRSLRRTIITGVGGLIGGFLGGFLFDFMTGEGSAQFVGLAITGLLIGLSIAVLEEGRKNAWIEITAGGMAGKQFILYQDIVTIGSSPDCNITVIKDPSVLPQAAVIARKGDSARLTSNEGSAVKVDGVFHSSTALRDGSVITIGGTSLQYRERSHDVAEIGSIRR